jgi:hypothetical protein
MAKKIERTMKDITDRARDLSAAHRHHVSELFSKIDLSRG